MERKRPTLLTAKGNKMTRDPSRIEFAAEAIRTMNYAAAQAAIEAEFGVGKTTAQADIAAARKLIALEFGDVVAIRAREATRLERLAEKAEGLADHASNAKDYQGAAALKGKAIQASKESRASQELRRRRRSTSSTAVPSALTSSCALTLSLTTSAASTDLDALGGGDEGELVALGDGELGRHGGRHERRRALRAGGGLVGRAWEAKDGSRVHAGKPASVPNAGSIPLLRLEAADTSGTGLFTNVAFIHRLDTTAEPARLRERQHV